MANKHRDPHKEAFWRRVLARWERSGQTGRDFCRAAGLSEASFYGWRRELARRDAARPRFVPVHVLPEPEPAPGTLLEIVMPAGLVVRVPSGFDAATLRHVLAALEPEARSC